MPNYTVNVLINGEWTLIAKTNYYTDALDCVHRHNCGDIKNHYQYQIIETTTTIIDHDEIMKTIDA